MDYCYFKTYDIVHINIRSLKITDIFYTAYKKHNTSYKKDVVSS
jgi:hypothetical protein